VQCGDEHAGEQGAYNAPKKLTADAEEIRHG
jgi:hypothetical protein